MPPIITGQLTTKQTFNFLYGRVEIRARLPSAKWLFPQLFLEPKDNIYGKTNYQSGQLRVAFLKGGDSSCTIWGGPVLGDTYPDRIGAMCKKPCIHDKLWSDDFHVYGLAWTPSK